MLQALRVALAAVAIAMVAGTDIVNNLLNSIPEVITRGLQIAGGFIVVGGSGGGDDDIDDSELM